MNHPSAAGAAQPARRLRPLLLRLGAIAFGLTLLVGVEIALVLLDVGDPDLANDPFVGFQAIRPLFELDESQTRFEVAKDRLEFFRPESFAAVKAGNEFRTFVLGGSTVQGNPYAIETSFTTWLELSLTAADPSRKWDVVNCGGISYASYRLVPILDEILRYQPDLVIVMTGENEFLEDRTYERVKSMPPVLVSAHHYLNRLRSYQLARQLAQSRVARANTPPALLPAEVQAVLDYRGGLEVYHRDDEWRRSVLAHLDVNLRRMADKCRTARVPLIFMTPLYNLADCPPFKSQHRDGLEPEERDRFDDLWAEARDCYRDDLPKSLRLLKEAAALDREHAGIRFELGKCYLALGLAEQAKLEFVAGKELDVCPLRVLETALQTMHRVGAEHAVVVIDARPDFEAQSRSAILGNDWFLDHLHPTIPGHRLLAGLVLDRMRAMGLVAPVPDWQAKRAELYERQLESLGDKYYLMGELRLTGLRRWAQGRGNLIRPPDAPKPRLGMD